MLEAEEGLPAAGPACGWVMAYVELMMSEYGFSLAYVVGSDPAHYLGFDAGMALVDARRERLRPGSVIGHVQRAVAKARDQVRQWYEAHFTLMPHAEFLKATATTSHV